ncbi:sarcosine oxidase subunit gamma [Roseivivax halodurans JCM 10272]|uniref:Sarcosine oxidase subunit gamma n=1 Tax=Roseivivax halodurans JCM 10272 TaxID=1449350 RepID=X7EEJ7_9RHOB|nr:sarcosine oxidase subunit gamma family protein [Roseivivax halodurans]ETX14342.1 sarcosine oxidase subunit gamma [Roseivivax halodurans JCM 10272]
MFDAATTKETTRFEGLVTVEDTGLAGMITIRGARSEIGGAMSDTVGLPVPETLRVTTDGRRSLAWMSPDELMLFCGHEEAADLAARLAEATARAHALILDMSDARTLFTLTGAEASLREVLAKLTPADMRTQAFPRGMIRRTRLAQVSGAIWWADDGSLRVMCFRSVADYVRGLLCHAAHPASWVGHFRD